MFHRTGCRTATTLTRSSLTPVVSISGSNPICLNGLNNTFSCIRRYMASNSANATVNNAGVVTPVSQKTTATFHWWNKPVAAAITSAVTINANLTISLYHHQRLVQITKQNVLAQALSLNITVIGGGGRASELDCFGYQRFLQMQVYSPPLAGFSRSRQHHSCRPVTGCGPCVNSSLSGTITINPNATSASLPEAIHKLYVITVLFLRDRLPSRWWSNQRFGNRTYLRCNRLVQCRRIQHQRYAFSAGCFIIIQ